jgi:Domain of unknown function (DUF4157)
MSARTTAPTREATQTFTAVQTGRLQRKCACGQHTIGGGNCGGCEKKARRLQRRSAPDHKEVPQVPEVVNDVLRSSGQMLDAPTRSFMESRFGHDFSQVRVHTDAKAAESAQAVNALAYTVGSDIVLGAGQYAPGTSAGRRLLAHELTHVVQQHQQGADAQVQAMAIEAETSPAEAEAERMSQDITSSEPLTPVRETMRAGHMGRAAQSASAPASAPAQTPASAPATATTQARASRQQRVRLDILGADMSVKDALVRSAAQALGTDIRVSSLYDMITKLEAEAGPTTGRCVENLAIWNHGSPGGQMVVGSETIRPTGGKPYSFPYSGLTIDWLLSEGNQAALNRLRDVFCCDAKMQWLGCGTAGVEAEGGVRTEAEQAQSKLRYQQHGDRYQDAQDAAEHGANLMGATFGNLNVQSWADATCTTITASTDFTYFSPSTPGKLYSAGHGGKFVGYPPRDEGSCLCDPETGRPKNAWTITEGKRFIREREQAAMGGDYLWHLYLETFQSMWKLHSRPGKEAAAAARIKTDAIAALRRLILEAAAKITIPGSLPVGDVRPWTNVDTANPEWAAVTSPHLIFCFPDNCWRWIMVNQKAIQTTPSHTQQVLAHELLHAADMWKAAQDSKRENGEPPAGAGDRCKPAGQGVRKGWTDAWGQYINKFVDFYEGQTTAQRHVDIYAESVKPHWAQLTMQERLTWFGGMLQNVPPDLPTSKTFEAEQMVLRLFRNPRPEELALRQQMGAVLADVTVEAVLGDDAHRDLGKGRTLLSHFDPMWRLRPQQRGILLQAVK